MCGIAGILLPSQHTFPADNFMQDILHAQHHRGPDYQQYIHIHSQNNSIYLGHNRLSIIDLSSEANQPFWDNTQRYCISFNGVIYNYLELRAELISLGHSFRTNSDTEVIVNAFLAWGDEAINHFNGMFAFALYDKQEGTLLLARDRFGVKPLYFYKSNEIFSFASTSATLAKTFSLKPNLNYIAKGIQYWLYEDDSEFCAYEDLYMLPAAHTLKIHPNLSTELHQYYDFQTAANKKADEIHNYNEKTLTELIRNQLKTSVDIRLRADVPIGISLSGGLDSSSIAALSKQYEKPLLGFTLGNTADKNSEAYQVAKLSEKIQLPIIYINGQRHNLSETFWQTLEVQDAPFASCSIMGQHLVMKTAKEHGVKVLLGGQGGDEAFLGYRKFFLMYLKKLLSAKKLFSASALLMNLVPTAISEMRNISHYQQSRRRYQHKNDYSQYLNLPKYAALELGFQTINAMQDRQITDITRYSLPTLLRYEDRNSMGASIESRLPFLDYQLMELAVALPTTLKIRHGYGKWILRKIAKGQVPYSIRRARYKRGFDVPEKNWISSGLGNTMREFLHDHRSDLTQLCQDNININKLFSDSNLTQHRNAFISAVSLIWLMKRL